MKTVDVKFIGGAMSEITLTMETNEFQDGDLLNFHGDSYLMKSGKGYFVKPALAPDSHLTDTVILIDDMERLSSIDTVKLYCKLMMSANQEEYNAIMAGDQS